MTTGARAAAAGPGLRRARARLDARRRTRDSRTGRCSGKVERGMACTHGAPEYSDSSLRLRSTPSWFALTRIIISHAAANAHCASTRAMRKTAPRVTASAACETGAPPSTHVDSCESARHASTTRYLRAGDTPRSRRDRGRGLAQIASRRHGGGIRAHVSSSAPPSVKPPGEKKEGRARAWTSARMK